MPPRERKDDWTTAFGAFVTRLRKERHWTSAELARRIQHSPNWVRVLEKGGNGPSLRSLNWLAYAFGVPAWELLRRFEEERAKNEAAAKQTTETSA